jgi:hypothetical protein
MKKKSKNLMFKAFIGVITAVMISWPGFGRILQNGSGGGYGGDGDEIDGPINAIENLVVEGAGHYLNANKQIQELLNLVELQDLRGIDFNELRQTVDSALYHVNRAEETYRQLIRKAEITPYKESVIAKLKAFDYSSFMQQNGLNAALFKEVESYLANGDITGIYKQSHSRFLDIIDMLNKIKEDTAGDKMPDLSIFRRLNETCAEVSLFGSYTARVFHTIL